MRKVIVTEFLTLDGVMEEPSSWQRGYESPEIGQFKQGELLESGALPLGRVTYEGFAESWPTATGTGTFGERMKRLPKFVATTTPGPLEWNATAFEGAVVAAVEGLKRKEGGNLLVYGSGTLARTLLRHDLVDELRLMVYPIVLGSGKRFFAGGDRLALNLINLIASGDLGAGVMLLTYAPTTETPSGRAPGPR